MSTKPNDFKIGLFVIFGAAILLAALFIFGASKWFKGKTIEETYVTGSVDGLKVGAPVTLRGVPVGQVTKINFTWNVYKQVEPRYVYVEFEVDNQVALAPRGGEYTRLIEQEVEKGLRARIKSQGLAAGTTIVSLEYLPPREHPPAKLGWKPRHIYIPSAPSQMSEILSSLDQTMAEIKQINFGKIGELVETDLHAGGRLLDDADKMNLRQMGANINQLVTEVQGVATRLGAFIGPTNQLSEADLRHISQHADELLSKLEAATGKLDQSIANLDMQSLNETLENFRRASQDLRETIAHIKQYPAGALLGQPPQRARSVERTGR